MLPIQNLEALPQVSGIYRVLDAEGNVIYIGQAQNIYDRWNDGHQKLGKIIAEHGLAAWIDWAVIPEWLLNRAENAAVTFYQPKFNSKTPPVV